MSRPLSMPDWTYPERYLANRDDRQFHDLSNETAECNITEIIDNNWDMAYEYETDAKRDGYTPCPHCMPDEGRAIE